MPCALCPVPCTLYPVLQVESRIDYLLGPRVRVKGRVTVTVTATVTLTLILTRIRATARATARPWPSH